MKPPANDADLIQAVKTALGRAFAGREVLRGASKPSVSSCKMVVTLHGVAPGEAQKLEEVVRSVRGVEEVVSRPVRAEGSSAARSAKPSGGPPVATGDVVSRGSGSGTTERHSEREGGRECRQRERG